MTFSVLSDEDEDPCGIFDDEPGIGGGGGLAVDAAGEADLGTDDPGTLFSNDPLPSEGGGFLHPIGRCCASSVLTEAHGALGMFRALSTESSRRALFAGGAVRFPIGICKLGTVPPFGTTPAATCCTKALCLGVPPLCPTDILPPARWGTPSTEELSDDERNENSSRPAMAKGLGYSYMK